MIRVAQQGPLTGREQGRGKLVPKSTSQTEGKTPRDLKPDQASKCSQFFRGEEERQEHGWQHQKPSFDEG